MGWLSGYRLYDITTAKAYFSSSTVAAICVRVLQYSFIGWLFGGVFLDGRDWDLALIIRVIFLDRYGVLLYREAGFFDAYGNDFSSTIFGRGYCRYTGRDYSVITNSSRFANA